MYYLYIRNKKYPMLTEHRLSKSEMGSELELVRESETPVDISGKEFKRVQGKYELVDISEPGFHNKKIEKEILDLEAGQARAVREAILSGNTQKLKEIDDKVVRLRAKLK